MKQSICLIMAMVWLGLVAGPGYGQSLYLSYVEKSEEDLKQETKETGIMSMTANDYGAAEGLNELLGALRKLRKAHKRISSVAEAGAPGNAEERMSLELGRAVNHISKAIADVPAELWARMMVAMDVQADELQQALHGKAAA